MPSDCRSRNTQASKSWRKHSNLFRAQYEGSNLTRKRLIVCFPLLAIMPIHGLFYRNTIKMNLSCKKEKEGSNDDLITRMCVRPLTSLKRILSQKTRRLNFSHPSETNRFRGFSEISGS